MKKIKIMFLVAILVFTMIPQTVSAVSREDSTEVSSGVVLASATIRRTALELGGKSESNEAEGWSWNAEERVLTLNNATIIADASYALKMPSGTIILKGENTIKSICNDEWVAGAGGTGVAGIRCSGDSLVIEGSGSLTAIGGASRGGSSGISGKHITINSGEVFAQGGASRLCRGINSFLGKLTINGGSVVAQGGPATGSGATSYGVGSGSFIMTGGSLTATAGSVPASDTESSGGVHVDYDYDIDISGVTVVKPADWTAGKKYILDSNGNVAQEVIIQGDREKHLKSPAISLTTDTTISEGTKTSVVWEPVEGAFRYYLNVIDKTTGIYDEKDRILNFDQTSYEMAVDGGHTYEIFVKSVDPNGNESSPSNVITLAVKENNPANQKINQENVFQTQERGDTCTYAAATSMLRRHAILEGVNDWSSITEKSVRDIARASGGGMRGKFTYKGMHVQCPGNLTDKGYRTIAQKKGYFIELLKVHPEGIVVYSRDKSTLPNGDRIAQHAILLTDYDLATDTFYCADSATIYAGIGRMKLTESSIFRDSRNMPVKTYSQNDIIEAIDAIWYINESKKQKEPVSSNIKVRCPVEMAITINGETLDSREVNGVASTRYASMTTSGSGTNRNVEVAIYTAAEEMEVELFGTDSGHMTFIVEHRFSDDTIETHTMQNIPVNATTLGSVNEIIPQSTVSLSLKDSKNKDFLDIWTADPDEIATKPSKDFEDTPIEETPFASSSLFSDISSSAYYYNAVQWAIEQGITNGTSNTTFGPSLTCTRGQVVTFLWRAAGSPKPSSNNTAFADVVMGSYYYDAVSWAIEKGITNGTSETTFSPNRGCTRGQVVTFIHRYENTPKADSTKNPFTDVKSASYYYDAVLWAVGKSITNGTSANTFGPDATCTRGQIVTFLYRDLA